MAFCAWQSRQQVYTNIHTYICVSVVKLWRVSDFGKLLSSSGMIPVFVGRSCKSPKRGPWVERSLGFSDITIDNKFRYYWSMSDKIKSQPPHTKTSDSVTSACRRRTIRSSSSSSSVALLSPLTHHTTTHTTQQMAVLGFFADLFGRCLLWLVGKSSVWSSSCRFETGFLARLLVCACFDVSPFLCTFFFLFLPKAPTMSNHVALVHSTYNSNMFEKTAWATVQDSLHTAEVHATYQRAFFLLQDTLVHTISIFYISRTQTNKPILKLW